MSDPDNHRPPPSRSAWGIFVYGGMVAFGALLLTLCGSCTLYFGGGSIWSLLARKDDASLGAMILIIALVVGGVPAVGGLVLLLEGLKYFRRTRG